MPRTRPASSCTKVWASITAARSNMPDSSSDAGWTWPCISSYCARRPRRSTVDRTRGGSLKRLLCLLVAFAALPASAERVVPFYWFEYTGHDPAYTAPLPRGSFHNPILAGYYPDPSVTRVGDKYYLVNSTFAHWPGIPVHESTDLVHWKLIGHALADPTQVSF